MDRKLKIDIEEAKALYIEGIRELEAHSKRDYIEKNLERGTKYPSVSFMAQRFNISFDECRELAGVEKKAKYSEDNLRKKPKWAKEELEEIIRSLGEEYGYDSVTHEFIKEKLGIYLTFHRYFGYGLRELKERLKDGTSKGRI